MQLDSMLHHARSGRPPAAIYADPSVHEAEQEHLFGRTWQFLAHESEIPEPGDYVVRRILDDSFIVVRDDRATVRVLLNVCLHKGMQVCRSEKGRASNFRCPYHAWTYRNTGELIGVPFHLDAYGGDRGLVKADRSLRIPRWATHRGMIFACLDPAVPDLDEYLADYAFYLGLYLQQSVDGSVFLGPQRWRINANWKIAAENFAGDSYHTPHTHASIVDIGLFREPRADKRKAGATYQAGPGAGTTYKLPTRDLASNLAHVGYPPEMVERMRQVWSPEQQSMVGEAGFMPSASTLFPNLSIVQNWPQVDADGLVVPFISVRLWLPLGPDSTEVLSWFVVDRAAPGWFQKASYRAYLMCFGSSGMFEQDDVENWTSITAMARGRLSSTILLDCTMGLTGPGGDEPAPIEWPGPGRAYLGFSEHSQRDFLKRWADYCSGAPVQLAFAATAEKPALA
jgi:phenylpropionate dioxygenase-like ring-hydroxylating dioxygenase large terminal subunit